MSTTLEELRYENSLFFARTHLSAQPPKMPSPKISPSEVVTSNATPENITSTTSYERLLDEIKRDLAD